jgi:hypothetical protein
LISCLVRCKDSGDQYGELTELAGMKTDKGLARHNFTEPYEYFFRHVRQTASKMLEIGIAEGGSLDLWKEYFPRAVIYGIDIDDKSRLDSKRIRTFIADQSDRTQLEAFGNKFGGNYDIIIDDGGHSMNQQQMSFGFLFKYVKPGGFYVIEDVHTSLSPQYGATEDPTNTTLAMIDNFLKSGRIESPCLSQRENRYLSMQIEYGNLFIRNNL